MLELAQLDRLAVLTVRTVAGRPGCTEAGASLVAMERGGRLADSRLPGRYAACEFTASVRLLPLRDFGVRALRELAQRRPKSRLRS